MRYLISVIWLFLYSFGTYAASEELVNLNFGAGGAEHKSGELEKLVDADPHTTFELINSVDLDGGEKIHRYRQVYQDVPVYGFSLALKESNRGRIVSIYGRMLSNIEYDVAQTKAKKNEIEIQKIALKGQKAAEGTYRSEKWIYRDENSKAHIVYMVSWFDESKDPTRPFMIFDANSAQLLDKWEGLATKDATGPGGNVKTGKYYYGKDLGYLEVSDNCAMTNSVVDTIDMKNQTNGGQIHQFPCSENTVREVNGAYSPLNDGHYFARKIFSMYSDWYGKSPLTHKLVMRIHYKVNYQNAFWNGQEMTFGDGGNDLYPLVNMDVTGHEVSHGFTEQNSNLAYQNQSGGINEAFSDMAGEALEFYVKGKSDLICGDDISKKGAMLRFMDDPTKDGSSIGHIKDFKKGMDVHYSSGVFNKAFYNIATAKDYDVKRAFDIFVLANQVYWNQNTAFEDGACSVYKAAKEKKYPLLSVYKAFKLVGITPCNEAEPAPTPTPTPTPDPTPTPTPTPDPAPGIKVLENMVPMGWFSGAANSNLYFKFTVPEGQKKLKVRSGVDSLGKGDVSLYVKYGSMPIGDDIGCYSNSGGLNEECSFSSPKAGDYYIWIPANSDFDKLMVQGIYQ